MRFGYNGRQKLRMQFGCVNKVCGCGSDDQNIIRAGLYLSVRTSLFWASCREKKKEIPIND